MLLLGSISCNDLGECTNTVKTKKRKNRKLSFLVLRIWLLKCILPTICIAHESNYFINTEEYNSAFNWTFFHSEQLKQIAKVARITETTTVDLTNQSLSICFNYQYEESAENFFICLHEIVTYFKISNETTISNLQIKNETKHETPSMTAVISQSLNKGDLIDSAKNLKNLIEIIELFLCLLIASCIELFPVGWQQFRQWQQQRFHSSLTTTQNSQRGSDHHFNEFETGNICLKFSFWQWLLSNKKKCSKPALNRKQQLSKAKKCLNAFLTVKLPLTTTFNSMKQQEIILQEYAFIIWNIIVYEMMRITTNELKTCCLIYYLTREGVATPTVTTSTTSATYESTHKKRCPKDRANNVQNKKSHINNISQFCKYCPKDTEVNIKKISNSKQQQNYFRSNNQTSQPNCHNDIDCVDSKVKHKTSDAYFCSTSSRKPVGVGCNSSCCTYCCCWNFENMQGLQVCCSNNCCCCTTCAYCCCSLCCCCCCCNLCCNSTWSCCCICQCKECCCWCKKTNQIERTQWLYQIICSNSIISYFQNVCQNMRAKAFSYIQKLCTQNIQFYQRRQKQQKHTTPVSSTITQKKNFCIGHHGIANCTSNYQQLEASNICKFFCNNRKRQRRRRRKRRRHRHRLCTRNVQACSCNTRVGQLIKTKNDSNNFFHISLKCNQQQKNNISLLSPFINYIKQAVKTIININKSNKQQQEHTYCLNEKFLIPTITGHLQPIIKSRQHTQTLKRIHCRGIKSWPNLAWLFIGLVWFESSRLVDCDLQRQLSISEGHISSEHNTHRTVLAEKPTTSGLNFIHECSQMLPSYKNEFNNQPIQNKNNIEKRMFKTNQKTPAMREKSAIVENNSGYTVSSDQIRLESIKNQILSKLGLSVRPNVSHPLPKQFIWDTISRIDELDNVIKNFDYAAKVYRKTMVDVENEAWNFMDDYDRNLQTMQVRAHRNSTHAPHQSYSVYSEHEQQQFNSIPQLQQKQHKNNRNHKNNKKLTYLSGIPSDMKVSVTLVGDKNYLGKSTISSQHELNNDAVVTELHRYQQIGANYEHKSDTDTYTDGQEFYGKTEDIISFAEEGDLYNHHRLIEFRTKSMDVFSNEKLYVRSAEIHMRIDSTKASKSQKKLNEGKKLKIWIFRMTETNYTQKGFDEQIKFCDAFEIDTRHLGWKKLDITETVRDWFFSREQESTRKTQRLRLLIDCTGCGDQYRLKLFKNDSKEIHRNKNKAEGNFKNDVVADWLQQQIEHNSDETTTDFINFHNNAADYHSYSNPDRPFLVIRTERHRPRRVRRRVVDCSGALRGQCCKESFYVSFKALGWDDWIIAPRGYFANYCRGDCTGSFRTPDTFQTFHAHFIEEYRKMGLLNGMKPCCAPIKFSSMSLIYYGDDGIIKRDLPKMVVDECGCP